MPLTLEHLHSLGAERPNDYLKFDENPDSINQTLQWMKDLSSADFTFAVGEKRINEQFKIMNAQLKGLAATASKNISIQKNFYFSQAVGYLFKNLRKGLNNLLQGRKKRKWLTILGSMGLGAGVGAIIGTMVFPLLGTAVGGALGSAIGGISAAVAGPIGLSFLGGAFGTWLGRKFAKKFAPSKSVYNISEKAKSSLKLMLNLEEDELVKLHAYLINRANSVKDPTLKKALRLLDNTIFKNKAPTGVVRLTDFLKSELAELEQLDAPNSQHEADKQFIQKILAKLPNHLNPLQSQTALQDKNIQSDNDSKQPNANLVQDKKLK
ncbi:MAG TPA: hypothetical protein VFP93_02640, partial [Gammaproteobacteria bacterium]|nr:hypothetical protein [Gammaproteobacteria bacterium]